MNEAILNLSNNLASYSIVIALIVIVLSSLIGLEREFNGHAAGLRTHILFALCMAIVGIFTLYASSDMRVVALCCSVIALAIISAGSVVQTGKDIKGITTSSTIFLVGLVGFGCGMGYVAESMIFTFVALCLLVVLSLFEKKTSKSNPIVTLLVDPKNNIADDIVKISNTFGLKIINISSKISVYHNQEVLRVQVTLSRSPASTVKAFADELKDVVSPIKLDCKLPRTRLY